MIVPGFPDTAVFLLQADSSHSTDGDWSSASCGTVGIRIQFLSAVAKSGITPFVHAFNSQIKLKKPYRGAVLIKPFPWTVTQGVILVLVIVNSQL
jgi:hypothetical protein